MPISMYTLGVLFDALYRPMLDCDGQSRVYHFFLTELHIPHDLFAGEIEEIESNRGFAPHYWIELETDEGQAIIDYKAQKWLGDDEAIAFGVFLQKDYPKMRYSGEKVDEEVLPARIIDILLGEE